MSYFCFDYGSFGIVLIPKMMRYTLPVLLLALVLTACSSSYKVHKIRAKGTTATLRLPGEKALPEPVLPEGASASDTLTVKDETGREYLIMRAVRDEESGGMVASEQLQAAVVTARFRHVAERGGQIELAFQISVPDSLMDRRWQLRFFPEMRLLGDTLQLDSVLITGKGFRQAQLRGYQQYERFLRSIARDSAHFVDEYQLEVFLERNLPQIYGYKSDTSRVSDEEFSSAFGVTGRQALEHYTNKLLVRSNARKIGRKRQMLEKYIRNPLGREGIRLDTVLRGENGSFVYHYTQTLHTRPRLRKVDVVLKGAIHDEKSRLYSIPAGPPLTFYVSSLSSFAQPMERYLTRVVERRAQANTVCYLDFASGSSDIQFSLGENEAELRRIRAMLASLLENETFDLDSVVVRASCSPEGRYSLNASLSQKRGERVCKHFRQFIRHYSDSLRRHQGFSVDEQGRITRSAGVPHIVFLSRNIPEDWDGLSDAVASDTTLCDLEKSRFAALRASSDPDERERAMRGEPFYSYIKRTLYPRLRSVRIQFHLHRKGMVKDTVHTTVPDTVYREGLQALVDHDYERAFALLKGYEDYNAAVAALALDRNAYARATLQKLPSTPRIDYMLAILYAREGNDEPAVQHYLDACRKDPSLVHRGNLDPEISALARRYNLQAGEE